MPNNSSSSTLKQKRIRSIVIGCMENVRKPTCFIVIVNVIVIVIVIVIIIIINVGFSSKDSGTTPNCSQLLNCFCGTTLVGLQNAYNYQNVWHDCKTLRVTLVFARTTLVRFQNAQNYCVFCYGMTRLLLQNSYNYPSVSWYDYNTITKW